MNLKPLYSLIAAVAACLAAYLGYGYYAYTKIQNQRAAEILMRKSAVRDLANCVGELASDAALRVIATSYTNPWEEVTSARLNGLVPSTICTSTLIAIDEEVDECLVEKHSGRVFVKREPQQESYRIIAKIANSCPALNNYLPEYYRTASITDIKATIVANPRYVEIAAALSVENNKIEYVISKGEVYTPEDFKVLANSRDIDRRRWPRFVKPPQDTSGWMLRPTIKN